MKRASLVALVIAIIAPTATFADTIEHIPAHIAGWRGGWNPTWHPRLEDWPNPAAGAAFAEFDPAALQSAIATTVAAHGGWDAKVVVTQVEWVDDAIPANLDPVVGAVDIDPSTLSWFSAYAYSAGSGSWRYDSTNYGSFAEAVLAGAVAGDSLIYEPDVAHWQAVWKSSEEDPYAGHDYWNVVIDIPESLITHYIEHPSTDGLFVGARIADGDITVFGYDQWGGSVDIRIVIDPPPATDPWISPIPAPLSHMMHLGEPVSSPLPITVNNAAGGTLGWTAAEAPDVAWISLTNTTGSDGDAFNVTIDASSLTPGNHAAKLEITDPTATNSPCEVWVNLTLFAADAPWIELAPTEIALELPPSAAPPAATPIAVNNAGFGSLNWSASIVDGPLGWLSLTGASGSDGDAVQVHIDHTSLPGGTFTAQIEITDPTADNSPQFVPVTLIVRDQDADIDKACSYDDTWETGPDGWIAHCHDLYENKDPAEQTHGFVVRLGDSITYANPGGQWAQYGAGKTAADTAICGWMHAAESWPDPIHNDSPNGWFLSRVDVPGRNGSYTARSSITAQGILTGWGGLPSADEMFTEGFTNPDGKQYRDAEITVILLGTNDVSGPRPTQDFIADLEAIADKILANNTIVVLTTLPPRRNREAAVAEYNAAVRALAQTKCLPLIDFQNEVERRRPDGSWDGTLISSDGVHPSASYGGFSATSDPYADSGAALSHSGYLLWCWLAVQKVNEIKAKCIDASIPDEWLDPADPDVDVVLNTADTGLAFYGGPMNQAEWLINRGTSSTVRIKNHDDPALLKWDLSTYAGMTITAAELHVARSNPSSEVYALAASTINADWNEGTTGEAVNGNPCWRWRSYNAADPANSTEWTFPGSDFTTASFGNFGTLTTLSCKHSGTFKTYENGAYTWIAMKLDPALVHALILDQSGLTITDGRGRTYVNPSIYTREQSEVLQPRLYLKATSDDTTPPADIAAFSAEPGEWNGEVVLSVTAPADPDEDRAFGYDARYSTGTDYGTATPVERWRIPRPLDADTEQTLLIENLTPGETYHFFIRAYDHAGNATNIATTTLTLPPVSATPALADGAFPDPDPTGKPILGEAGVLNIWACSELAKVNPATGNRIADGYTGSGADDYKKANAVWDSAANTISLRAARNEVVSFQLIIERLLANLTTLAVTADDLTGPGSAILPASETIELFKLHYVQSGGSDYADPAIPLFPPFETTFDIPSINNPGGTCQSVWADIYIPEDAAPGTYTTTLTVSADQLSSPIDLTLQIEVYPVTLPNESAFVIDLNGYGNKWSSEASRYQVFQLCQKHRLVPNTLPYGWTGSVNDDRAPVLTGSGPSTSISDWSDFTANYGPFLDGSGFSPNHPTYPYHGPGQNTPIPNFYTTFHEGWPLSLTDTTWGFDAEGSGWSYWNALVDAEDTAAWHDMPDTYGAFPEGYETGYQNVARQFAEYAQAQGWHGTAFQMYLNNKYYYDPCIALWTLEEQSVADDFRATAYFLDLCKQGVDGADAPDVRWHYRIDTSTRWGQNWGQLSGICNFRVIGNDIEWYYRQARYRNFLQPLAEAWSWYGTGPSASDPLTDHPADILRHWSHGLDGGLPYWDNFHTDWTNADDLAILPSGADVPGHGAYDGRIATIRMKGMRFGVQLAEQLNQLAAAPNWNRTRVARALSDRYGDHAGIAYDPFGGDAYDGMTILDHYRLHADLLASLSAPEEPGDMNCDGVVDINDVEPFILALLDPAAYTAAYPDCSLTRADCNTDGVVNATDIAPFTQRLLQ